MTVGSHAVKDLRLNYRCYCVILFSVKTAKEKQQSKSELKDVLCVCHDLPVTLSGLL